MKKDLILGAHYTRKFSTEEFPSIVK